MAPKKVKKKPGKKPNPTRLTPLMRKVVACYEGNQVEACRKAGMASPVNNSGRMFQDPRVKKAIAAKEAAFLQQLGKREATGVTLTRNDIINGLAQIAQSFLMPPPARVAAYGHLKDIYGLSAKSDRDTDIFAGWSKEELDQYARTGELPSRFGSGEVPSGSETSSGQPGID